jgi:hypothetical protein
MFNKINYKLGKQPAKFDNRTLKFSKIVNKPVLPPIPEAHDVDKALNTNIVEDMLGNDTDGDCVIAGRANLTWRYEWFQQGKQIPISTQDCLNEYWKEQQQTDNCPLLNALNQHPDNGLVMLDSLNKWRKEGWVLGGKAYSIYAYAALALTRDEIQQVICLLNGAYIGINVSQSAMDQFKNGQMWDIVDDDGGIIGGHCIPLLAYDVVGPICVTWAKRQQMSWSFFAKYCDEAYGIVDQKDAWVNNDPLNIDLLQEYLDVITNVL